VLRHDRQELLAHVLAHGVADEPLLVVELRVQRERIERVERRERGGGHVPKGTPEDKGARHL
jgi:hypothetical protein